MKTDCSRNTGLNRSADSIAGDAATKVYEAVRVLAAARGISEPIPPSEELRALRIIFRAVTNRMVDLKREVEGER